MKVIISIAFLSVALISCRKTVQCPTEQIKVSYIGYPTTEIDTVRLYRYEKGTNFATLIDSLTLTQLLHSFSLHGDTTTISVPNFTVSNVNINAKTEFDIKLINLFDTKTTFIKDINAPLATTTISVFAMDPGTLHCTSPVMSFTINGTAISNSGEAFVHK